MNISQMLGMTVTPLAKREATPTAKKNAPKNPNVAIANKIRHNNSLEKYRAAMGLVWLTTDQIERRMGLRPRGSGTTLTRWYRDGVLERRPTGGAEEYNPRKGYEWRFKE